MFEYRSQQYLPTAEDLPSSDDTPLDNQLQHLIPTLLEEILARIWGDRWDWYFGVDMGVYYDPDEPAIVPDGFLSLGVERLIDEDLRLSYLVWEEKQLPILVIEIVSETYRGEYSKKRAKYAEIGILYYAVYNPRRRRKPPLEVYRLVEGSYDLLPGNPVWIPEIGLGIGKEEGTHQGITRDWLYWYNEQGQRYLTAQEYAQQAEQRAIQAEQRARMLEEKLRSQGIDPDL
ncbi:Uma2 family endonuclease [Aliterella atlantica]|uniref:Putative restriction endonuclease domain-containing protein n=1 Tax=Aliterella atlantica CENA595 TaxID=1618023 RepID=A0A0D8ZQU3_9CYAN|nr:Uma2 family endonuclease [Aliterella atlantica]KJH70697.1 hypothetical protein UH38_16720 [Aliterella atlantica CENA595]